jgi:hypothetical protein
MAKKKGGRSFYATKHNGFYLSPKKKDNDNAKEVDTSTMAKGTSMRNSNAAHRTCQ